MAFNLDLGVNDLAVSINERASKLVKEMMVRADDLNLRVFEAPCQATIIDCGVEAKGSIEAGLYVARITAGDLIQFSLINVNYGDFVLPAISASSDHPLIATLGGQLGDWEIRYEGYFAIGSGPARALALDRKIPASVSAKRDKLREKGLITYTPREIYEKINYRDRYSEAVIVLESNGIPPDAVLRLIADECRVSPSDLYALVVPISSLAGSVPIAGRIIEVGIHKLGLLGFDLTRIIFGSGIAPIAPPHPDPSVAMGRTNDAIRYGGSTYYIVDADDDEKVRDFILKVPPTDGKLFVEIFRGAKDFYDVDLQAFAPAVISATNVRTGKTFSAGHINIEKLKIF